LNEQIGETSQILDTICLASTRTNLDAALGLLDISLLSRELLVGNVLGSKIFGFLDASPKGGVNVARLCRHGLAAHLVWLSNVKMSW
jgi:hypothetical protein